MSAAMIIDDSTAMRKIFLRSLTQLGFEVCSAVNGKDAIAYLEQNAPELDVLLVDWNMPEMNGLEFIQRMRAMPRYASLKVMMVTTENEIGHIVKALDAGANEYLMKPFTDESLADKLRLMKAIN